MELMNFHEPISSLCLRPAMNNETRETAMDNPCVIPGHFSPFAWNPLPSGKVPNLVKGVKIP